MNFIIDNEEYLDLRGVEDLVGIKQTLIYEKIRYGQFPKSHDKKVETTITVKKSRSLWKKSDIEEYLKNKEGKQSE